MPKKLAKILLVIQTLSADDATSLTNARANIIILKGGLVKLI